jgi:hypothetical protein
VDVTDYIHYFALFTGSLRSWSLDVSDTEGCFHLADARVVKSDCGLMDAECPVFLLLQHLRASEWNPTQGRVVHSIHGREFSMCRLSRRREYLQVLVRWGELARDGMTSTEPLAFYACLLKGFDVKPFEGAGTYRALLAGRQQPLEQQSSALVHPGKPEANMDDIVFPGEQCPSPVSANARQEHDSSGHFSM